MTKPRLLDLFCGAGGAGVGYSRAGFEVVGVDIAHQKHYPFEFHQADALKYAAAHGHEFDVIHASPPCQRYSVMTKGRWADREHPDLIAKSRAVIALFGVPYVIENVSGASGELICPIVLCGTMFGLSTRSGNQLRRHRLFECGGFWCLVPNCQHNDGSAIGVYGGGQNPQRRRPATVGVWGHSGGSSTRDRIVQFTASERNQAMGIDWMTQAELSEAIPPAYTEFIGKQLIPLTACAP